MTLDHDAVRAIVHMILDPKSPQADWMIERLGGHAAALRAEVQRLTERLEEMPGSGEHCDCQVDRSNCPHHHRCLSPACCDCTWCCANFSRCQNTPAAENGATT